ncbi:MAG: hypothetical protein JWM28_1019 [Chitinophagaceae bacterium]|nr:hypothetical protein [Chitinophagaceae bacterium]
MGYFFLILTVISETAAVIFMKLSDGFQNKLPAAIAITAYVLSFIFLTFALKYLPVGLANAVWAGASTVLVTILGIYIFKEQLSAVQFIFLSLIVIGLIGLNFSRSV